MNILFFITPKEDVAYIHDSDNIRQVMEKMYHHRYSSIPMLSKSGKYVGTITEGDLLWGLKEFNLLSIKEAESCPVTVFKRKYNYLPIHIETDMEDLIEKAMNQNFVPVVDDDGCFIGIIRRKEIIQYCYNRCKAANHPDDSKE